MDIFESLRIDHTSIQEILDELIDQTTEPIPREPVPRDEDWTHLFHDLKLAIVAHDRAEEALFYSLLLQIPDRAEIADIKAREHRLTEELLEDLEEINPQDKDWDTKIEILKNHLDNHISEEETNVFPLVQPLLKEDETRYLAHEFESLRDDIIEGVKYHPKGRSMINPAGLDLES